MKVGSTVRFRCGMGYLREGFGAEETDMNYRDALGCRCFFLSFLAERDRARIFGGSAVRHFEFRSHPEDTVRPSSREGTPEYQGKHRGDRSRQDQVRGRELHLSEDSLNGIEMSMQCR